MDEEIEPGLEGFSDSGSDGYDLPAPVLPKEVKKTILRQFAGENLRRPRRGDEVRIQLTRRDAKELLQFRLGLGEVMKGLELGLETMRIGEVARLSVSLASAYSSSGRIDLSWSQVERGFVFEVELLHFTRCFTLLEDGSVLKRVLVHALDRRQPAAGQECVVKYRLRPMIDSLNSLDHQETMYTVGEASSTFPMCTALFEAAVLSMRCGESASFERRAEDVYSGTMPSGVANDTMILLEIELLEIRETTDISFERNGSVMKKSLHYRDFWDKCHDAGRCTLLILSVTEGDAIVVQDQTLTFTLGDGEVCDVIECAAISMSLQEAALITCSAPEMAEEPKLGMARSANTVVFHVKVVGYEKGIGEQVRRNSEQLAFLESRKVVGVSLFKCGRFRLAAQLFHEIHRRLGYVDEYRGRLRGEDLRGQVADLKRSCLLNRALCALKYENFAAVILACDEVLDGESQNVKALLRRAQAQLSLGRPFEAACDARKVLELEMGGVAEAQTLIAQAELHQRQEDRTAKATFAKMCGALGSLPHPLDVD